MLRWTLNKRGPRKIGGREGGWGGRGPLFFLTLKYDSTSPDGNS